MYDGDGRQVKSVINGVTTIFVGAHYQIENGVVVKYYGVYGATGAQRIAIRKNGTLSYMVSTGSTHRLTDHLSSTTAITNTSGSLESGQCYTPRRFDRESAV